MAKIKVIVWYVYLFKFIEAEATLSKHPINKLVSILIIKNSIKTIYAMNEIDQVF